MAALTARRWVGWRAHVPHLGPLQLQVCWGAGPSRAASRAWIIREKQGGSEPFVKQVQALGEARSPSAVRGPLGGAGAGADGTADELPP